jgi:hypothetical protein
MVIIANHGNNYGKNDYNHERKIQDAHLIIESKLLVNIIGFSN